MLFKIHIKYFYGIIRKTNLRNSATSAFQNLPKNHIINDRLSTILIFSATNSDGFLNNEKYIACFIIRAVQTQSNLTKRFIHKVYL